MAEAKALTVQTPKFGEIEIPEDKIVFFSEGIPGFSGIRRFAILEFEELAPFRYLQSLDDPPITLLIINPFLLRLGYEVQVGLGEFEDFRANDQSDISVYAVATIPGNVADATVNLMAPILINEKTRRGKQVILLDSRFSVQHALLTPPGQDGARAT